VAVSTRSGAVLGGTRESWIAAWGEPSRGATGELFQIQNVAVEASFKEGLARHIEVLFDREVPNDVARMRAREFFPRDAREVRSYTAPAGQTVEVFVSERLAMAFAAEDFAGAEPGTFIQIAERGSPTTRRVVISVGDNP